MALRLVGKEYSILYHEIHIVARLQNRAEAVTCLSADRDFVYHSIKAEARGFEPLVPFPVLQFSRLLPSTARPRFRFDKMMFFPPLRDPAKGGGEPSIPCGMTVFPAGAGPRHRRWQDCCLFIPQDAGQPLGHSSSIL